MIGKAKIPDLVFKAQMPNGNSYRRFNFGTRIYDINKREDSRLLLFVGKEGTSNFITDVIFQIFHEFSSHKNLNVVENKRISEV